MVAPLQEERVQPGGLPECGCRSPEAKFNHQGLPDNQ